MGFVRFPARSSLSPSLSGSSPRLAPPALPGLPPLTRLFLVSLRSPGLLRLLSLSFPRLALPAKVSHAYPRQNTFSRGLVWDIPLPKPRVPRPSAREYALTQVIVGHFGETDRRPTHRPQIPKSPSLRELWRADHRLQEKSSPKNWKNGGNAPPLQMTQIPKNRIEYIMRHLILTLKWKTIVSFTTCLPMATIRETLSLHRRISSLHLTELGFARPTHQPR